MVTMNLLYFHLKDELGEVIYNTQRPSFYEDILHKKTLLYWSTMFPKIVKGIQITQNNAIPIKHPQTGITCLSGMYKVPKFNPNDEYINYEQVRYNGNLVMNQASSSLPVMNGMLNQVSSMLPNSQYFGVVRYSFDFIAPDILTIDPIPMKHLDFSLDMQRYVRLTEIPDYYFEDFKNLFLADCKISLYKKYLPIAKSSNPTYQGLEITTEIIADLAEGKDERKELIEKFEKNYWKDSHRYGSLLEYDAP